MSKIKQHIIQLTKELIQFQTVAKNHFELYKCADFISAYFENFSVHSQIIENNRVPSIIISTKKTKCPNILLHGHFDVVDIGSDSGFCPRVDKNMLWGRGACDMKSGVAMMMYAMREVIQKKPDIDIGLMLHGDEEIGSYNGARHLTQDLGYTTNLLINFDGGLNETISHAEKGIIRLILRSKVDNPYLLYNPWKGASAIDGIYWAMKKLKELFPGNEIATEEDNWHTTYAIRTLHAEQAALGEIPREAQMELTLYFVEDMTTQEYVEFLRRELPWLEIEPVLQAERVYASKDNINIKKWQEIMSDEFKKTIPIKAENGSSDARFFSHLKIPVIIVTPTGGGFHTDHEYVDTRCFDPFVMTLMRFLCQSVS